MSETLLEALMQLFALLTDVKKESRTGRAHSLVSDFLSKHFSKEYVDQYLGRFEVYLNRYHSQADSDDQSLKDKQSSDNKSRILNIASKINSELEQEPKVLLFVQLLDFLKKDDEIGEEEFRFVDLLAGKFRIAQTDYNNMKRFIIDNPLDVPDKNLLLLISGNNEKPHPDVKLLFNPKQQVIVWVLHITSTNTYIFRYDGERNLYLNGHKVERNRPYPLAVGSVIKTSRMPPVYYSRVTEQFIHQKETGRIIFRAMDVAYKFSNNQIGIHPFSFTGRSGQLVGIMGGSGTGKSTLLNVLNGNYKLSSGKIYINGYDLHAEKENLQGVIGYVPQDDLLKEELTVFENLWFNARLCFNNLNKEEIKQLVENALKDFDLVEARDMVVGTPLNKILSGGQRKRLNIALELIREPSILFVDEPTSGLSSMDSEKVMLLLKRQVLKGKLVIINIHQPSSDLYKLLDKLLMIDKGGRIIFNGNPMDAIAYFKKEANYVNPEERECYVCGNVKTEQPLRIVEARIVNPYGNLIRQRKVKPEDWYQLYVENFEEKYEWKHKRNITRKEPLPKNWFSIPGRKKQFQIFALRDALSKLKDKQYLAINILEAPILAIILGFFTKFLVGSADNPDLYIFSENVNLPAYLFMCVVVSMFIGLNVSAEEIIKDRKLLKRESFLNLSRFSFLNSKILVLFTISAIQTLSFVLIGNYILEVKGLTISYWIILFSTACFANMLGLNISSGLNSVVAIYVLIPLILIPHLLFSGVIVSYDKLHNSISSKEFVPRIGDLMVTRWSYEALAVNQFKNNRYQKNFFFEEMIMSQNSYYANTLIPELIKINDAANWAKGRNDLGTFNNQKRILQAGLMQLQQKYPNLVTFSFDIRNLPEYTIDIHQSISSVLELTRQTFNREYQHFSALKDQRMQSLIVEKGSVDAVVEFRQKFHNEALADWVMERKEPKQFEFTGEQFIQKRHPVFKEPSGQWGRAHFYSPEKRIGPFFIATPFFNTFIIWIGIVILYVTLYLDILRRIIHYFETFRLRQLNKRLQKLGT
ncbi:ATP-binding cassette domain-containing protein [Alkalitalea saponilacus]|uniref:ABC-type multidrug transport system, ATPase component n=1 Tax=Alkalitalea saponilacus TaxID=889453 RepID=A0A1T5A4K3_9BACT|nr:ATP-binding cassette domain-containing protein [Alkalitalea saponilacus]ASB48852.1 ABC transporter [Alkalitalea saponilacus]SKB29900.1 ABC-type multidrug transport system, ATPase component [Alkalitalea saponilacus]